MMSQEYSVYRFPLVWNPVDHIIYADDPAEEPTFQYPLMDARAWALATGKKGIGSDSAGGEVSDPLALSDIFFNNNNERFNMYDQAVKYMTKLHAAKSEPNPRMARQSAAALITSLDFTDFQNTVIIGENLESQLIKTGVLTGLFQEIATPNLGGKWSNLDSDVRWQRNIPEGKSPEPSAGTGTVTTVSVPKHGGAVAITQRAQDVINGDNPFSRLVQMLQRKRLEDENQMTASVIQANTANTIAGVVDFGLRAGTPPASSTNPSDFVMNVEEQFQTLKAPWNLFISKARAFAEFSYNDIVRGVQNPLPAVSIQNEQTSPFPLASGVTWARDNAITSATAGWALNDSAIKEFRGPTRTYTVANPDAETTRYVTKTHFQVQTMDATLVYYCNGITA